MSPTRKQLLGSAQAFCDAFSQKDMNSIMSHFSVTHQTTATEHGEAFLAPFLGKAFVGHTDVEKYFNTISTLLSYENMKFSEFIVDTETNKVACKGRAKFTWIETGESWDETFAYMLDFDEEGKITDYQVWADSGAAFLARKGELENERKKHQI